MRATTMHELGHETHFDWPEWKWARFERIVGTREIEVVAESYKDCSMFSRWQENAPMTTESARQFNRVCHLIRIPNQ